MNSKYIENVHRYGKIWFFIVWFFIILFPVVTCIYFDAWPEGKQFLTALIGVIPVYWTVGIVEAFTYMPMLGAGGSYLGFITGNMSNLKVPVAINAMESMGVQQGTEEGDVISTIVIAVSSLVMVLILVLVVILMAPLAPVFQSEVLQPAFSNVLPALFGGLMIAYMAKDTKVAVPTMLITAVLFILIPALAGVYPLILPVIAALAMLYSRFLYKRGKL